jgi:hypothetical protein
MRLRIPIERRILALYHEGGKDDCWPWLGKINDGGYGIIWGGADNPRELRAHRVMYEIHRGPIPDGLDLDHLCRVRHCVNPAHLEPVTRRENLRRSPIIDWDRTHCKRGHEFTEANTYITRSGYRNCRECHRLGERARRRGFKGLPDYEGA